jgi:hypothetical protein
VIAFVMPVFGRRELTKLCLDQLRWTCDGLAGQGIEATAIVVGHEEELLEHARERVFWTVHQENDPLARKFNDGIELAAQMGAEYVIPCGSDNWVHWRWISDVAQGRGLPAADEVVCHRQCAIVHESGNELAFLEISYDGGDGIRIFPVELFKPLAYRPAVDHRNRAIDTSIVERLRRFAGWTPKYRYEDIGFWSVIGWQSYDLQLNPYSGLVRQFGKYTDPDPWSWMEIHYPVDAVASMRDFIARRPRALAS